MVTDANDFAMALCCDEIQFVIVEQYWCLTVFVRYNFVTEVSLRLSPCRRTEETRQRLISFAFLPPLLRLFSSAFAPRAVMIAIARLAQNLEQLAWFPMLAASSRIFALVTK